jgi:site-specific DNA-methyltransferase (adenine-specific)
MIEKVEIGKATLYCGDCIEISRGFAADSFDAVLTDPPYSSGTRREGAKGIRKSMTREGEDEDWFISDSLTTDGFWWLMHANALQWKRVLKDGSHVLAFIDWRMWHHMAGAIEAADLRRFGMLVWDKTHFGMGMYFRNQHELVMHFSKGKGKDAARHDIGNVLRVKRVSGADAEHLTQKPVDLLEQMLSVISWPGDVVLDPFMGSGSTGVAATQLDRGFVGIEMERRYFDTACERIANAHSQQRLFAEQAASQMPLIANE